MGARDRQLGLPQYLRRAFLWHWNLLVFGAAAVAAVISPAPDIAIPLVFAAEATYLGSMVASPKFRKFVEGQERKAVRAASAAAPEDPLHAALDRLSFERQARFRRLRDRCKEMKRLAASVRGQTADADTHRTEALDRMLWTFVKLLRSEQALEKFMDSTDEVALQRRVEDIQRQLRAAEGGTDDRIRRALVDSSATAQLRLDNFDKAQRNARFVGIELDRIEDKIQALVEMAVGHEDPDFISSQVDSIAASVSDTEAVMREISFVPGVEELDETAPAILSENA